MSKFEDTINDMSQEELGSLLYECQKWGDIGPSVEEYFDNFKVCIFADFEIEQIKELITFYRNNADLSEAEKYNLDNLEKNLNTAINYNEFKENS